MVEKARAWKGALSLRAAGQADEPLLRRLLASSVAAELAYLDPSQQETFLELQWRAREREYQARYRDPNDQVVMAGDTAVGRLLTAREAGELVIVDLALLPEYRGRGIGSKLLERLLEDTAGQGTAVRLYVLRTNPAMRLYRRLGFSTVGEFGLYVLLQRRP